MQVTLDFETFFDTKYSLTQLTTMDYVRDERFKVWGVGVKINDFPTEWYGENEVEDTIRYHLDWPNVELVCHNALFDAYILTQYYGVKPGHYYDTAAISRGLYPGQSAKLKDVAERVFPFDTTMRKGDELILAKGIKDLPEDIEDAISGYCIQDVDLTYAIFAHTKHRMPESELDLINITTRMFVEPTLKVDRERLTKYRDSEIANTKQLIADSGVDRAVLASNQKFSAHIEELGIVPPTKRSPTTSKLIPALGKNDNGFKQLRDIYPEHNNLWKARLAVKSRIAETRAQRFLDAANEDDTIGVPLRYYAAHTGRFGGTEKLNMQNLPRGSELRKSLLAPKGMYVYSMDLSNIEARMLAWLAGDEKLLRLYNLNEDVYAAFASEIYGRPITKEKDPDERFLAKTAVLGLGYGMGGPKYATTVRNAGVEITDFYALEVVSMYRGTYPLIPAFWKKADGFLLAMMDPTQYGHKYGPLVIQPNALELPNGMSLQYKDLEYHGGHDGFTYKSYKGTEHIYGGRLTENIVQALARIIITDALVRIDERVKGYGGRVVLTVHDEIVVVAPQHNPDGILYDLLGDMCIPPEWALGLPLHAEGGYDHSYSK